MSIPLNEQIAEVEREIRMRARVYPDWIEKKRLKPETAETKLAALRAAQSTLMWLERNMAWIKPEAQRRAMLARQQKELDEIEAAERAAVLTAPAVQAVLEVFPDATVTIHPAGERLPT
jgi:transcription elongation GreA/GreB family factor